MITKNVQNIIDFWFEESLPEELFRQKDTFDKKSDVRFIRVEDYIMEGEKLLDMEGLKFIEGKLITGR